MPSPPLVTVLMSVFNDSAYLPAAVESVLRQTFAEFEFLIIDDGSTDGSPRSLDALHDPRVRVIRHPTNQGLTRSLKRGLELAEGRYIARMDADDVAFTDRLERQVAFLERHSEVVLLGGGCVQVDEAGGFLRVLRQPESDLEIRWLSLLNNPFVHSTVMVRRQLLREHGLNYDESFPTAQDYDLWSRLLRLGPAANLNEPLIFYRLRAGITSKRREQQLACALRVAERRIREELPDFTIERPQLEALVVTIFQLEAGSPSSPGTWARDHALYGQLLSAFARKHRGNADWRRVRRRYASAVLRSAWCHRFPRGAVRVLASAMAADPSVVMRLIQDRVRARAERRRFLAGLAGPRGA